MKKSSNSKPLKARKRFVTYIFLVIFSLIVLICSLWLYFSHSYKNDIPKKGSLAEDQQFPTSSESAYKNLDLSIVSKVHFNGSQIKTVRNLGTFENVNESIISYHVDKDNLTEYGLMTRPTTPKPQNGYPVIILCHGYATPKIYSTTLYYLADMVEYSRAGFVVIKPDFRGQGLSLNVGIPEGAYYSMAYNTDLMSLIADSKATDILDKNNISLWGHSMGAYIALRAAVISQDIKNLIILSGPVGNIQDMYRTYIPISDRNNPIANDIKQSVLLRYGTPINNPKFWNQVSPLSYLSQLKANVQIYAGSEDQVVPAKFSSDFDRALNNVHKKHQYFVFPSGDHGLLDVRDQIYENTLKLLETKSNSNG